MAWLAHPGKNQIRERPFALQKIMSDNNWQNFDQQQLNQQGFYQHQQQPNPPPVYAQLANTSQPQYQQQQQQQQYYPANFQYQQQGIDQLYLFSHSKFAYLGYQHQPWYPQQHPTYPQAPQFVPHFQPQHGYIDNFGNFQQYQHPNIQQNHVVPGLIPVPPPPPVTEEYDMLQALCEYIRDEQNNEPPQPMVAPGQPMVAQQHHVVANEPPLVDLTAPDSPDAPLFSPVTPPAAPVTPLFDPLPPGLPATPTNENEFDIEQFDPRYTVFIIVS